MPEPMYRRIAEKLRDEIESGRLEPGTQLPSESEMQDTHKASRNTVRQAMELLAGWGLVETRPGQGTFIRAKYETFVTTLSAEWKPDADSDTGLGGGEGEAAFNEVTAQRRKAGATGPRVEVMKASGYVARRLHVEEGTSVISRHQERLIDDQPWSLQTSYYPITLLERGARRLIEAGDIEEGAVKYLKEALGMNQVGYRDRILVRRANDIELRFFRLREDAATPVVVLLRTGYADEKGSERLAPFRLAETVFPADRNQFVINAGRVPGLLAEPAGGPDTQKES